MVARASHASVIWLAPADHLQLKIHKYLLGSVLLVLSYENVIGGIAVGTATQGNDDSRPYTGVVIVHGIGDEKRNETLGEVVNTLAHWFIQQAGFVMRSDGSHRIWLKTALTTDDNPDAQPSRATIDLVGRAPSPEERHGSEHLRLELREVWWAQSFGIPHTGRVLHWARVQFREEALRVLLPIRRRATSVAGTPGDSREQQHPKSQAEVSYHTHQLLLRLYGGIQYVWKLGQWLTLTPLIYLLLVLSSILKIFALIPFLRAGLVGALARVARYLTLHWIGPLEAYLDDYVRSSSIRELFENVTRAFLRDPHCERIVVIAHSMGTVIAYDGLATILRQSDAGTADTPITFICLGQALRRVWLLEGGDSTCLRNVLPKQVRWVNFWARYDPVAAGPLDASALPPITGQHKEADPKVASADAALRIALDSCKNATVNNTESLFTDHTTYWLNYEQVVGPIAHELVAGHPVLEEMVHSHLASPDEVLIRRWRLAWRATLALAAGLTMGVGLIVVDAELRLGVGEKLRDFLRSPLFQQLVIGLLTGNVPLVRCAPPCSSALPPHLNPIDTGTFLAEVVLLKAVDGLAVILELLAAGMLMGVTMVAIGKLTALSPVTGRGALPQGNARVRGIALVLAVVATVLFVGDDIVTRVSAGLPHVNESVLQLGGVALLVGIVVAFAAWLLCLIDAIFCHEWVWCAGMLVTTILGVVLLYNAAPILSLLVCTVFSTYVFTLVYLVMGPMQVRGHSSKVLHAS